MFWVEKDYTFNGEQKFAEKKARNSVKTWPLVIVEKFCEDHSSDEGLNPPNDDKWCTLNF